MDKEIFAKEKDGTKTFANFNRLITCILGFLIINIQIFAQCSGCTMTISSSSSATVTLTSTDVLCITGGTYNGTISAFPSGAKICVSGSAIFNPVSMPTSSGTITVNAGCSALLPSFAAGTGFKMENYGTVTFNSTFTLSGVSTINNFESSYITFTQNFILANVGSSITNKGTINFNGTYTGSNSTNVYNYGYFVCASTFTNGSSFKNYGKITSTGNVTFSAGSGSLFHNYCTLITNGGITNNNTNANGLINYGNIIADVAGTTITNAASCPLLEASMGTIVGVNFSNSGIVTGSGRFYFSGATSSLAGSFGADGMGLNFFDTGHPANIMDVETVVPHSSVTKNSFSPPGRADLVTTCQISVNQGPVAADDAYITAQNTSIYGNVFANDIDPENNALWLSSTLVANPSHAGSFSFFSNGDFNYTPASGYYGTDIFIYTVCDYGVPSICDTATVIITITQNAVPIPACDNPGTDPTLNLGSVPNTYYPATASAAAGSTSITLGSYLTSGANTPIAAGDKLLVIQIQGGNIDYSNTDAYGDGYAGGFGSGIIYNTYASAGNFEFVTATNSVPLTGGTLNIQSALVNSYDHGNYVAGSNGQRRFQVIRVPQYNNLSLTSNITVPGWNGSSGGVFCISVASTFNMAGFTIDAKGKGFRGGAGRTLTGSAGVDGDYRTLATLSANGSKGEGITGTPRYLNNNGVLLDNTDEGYPLGSYAQGAPGNAGGGGTDAHSNTINDENTGGGGGGNGGSGGKGGNAWNSAEPTGGEPGALFLPASPTRLVLGGGGGAGSTNNGTGTPANGLASSGSAGGGIVIIYADNFSNTGTIDVCGDDANTTITNDASGGGGAGGSVLLVSNNSLTGIKVLASGGLGGTNTGGGSPHGPGGGGGGGAIFSTSSINYASKVNGGMDGTTTVTSPIAYGSTPGNSGKIKTTVKKSELPSGFLGCFNFIVSANDNNITSANTAVSGYVLSNDFDTEGDAVVFAGFYNSLLSTYVTSGSFTVAGTNNSRNPVANAGTLSVGSSGAYTFTPAAGFTGKADIVYKVTDNDSYKAISYATLTVHVLPPCSSTNDVVPMNDNAVTYMNVPVTLNVLNNDLDPQGDSLLFSGFVNPLNSNNFVVNGSISMTGLDRFGDPVAYAGTFGTRSDGSCTFTPVPHFNGSVTINYEVCDANSSHVCKKSNLKISVEPVHSLSENYYPTVADNGAITYVNTPVIGSSLVKNAGDANGGTVSVNTTPVSGPSHGTLIIYSNGTYLYTPATGFSGTDSFIYRVCDDESIPACSQGVAYIYVSADRGEILDNPQDVDICIGDNTIFSVNATGTNRIYQWQLSINNGVSWSPVSNDATYSGATTSDLAISSATSGLNNNLYKCVIVTDCGTFESDQARLLVGAGTILVNANPEGNSVCPGGNAFFSIEATGPSIYYQWQESINNGESWSNLSNSSLYSGVATPDLIITGATAGMNNYRYRCMVSSNCAAGVASLSAVLNVGSPSITILNNPVPATICSGTNAQFSVYATGASLAYQWQENRGSVWSNLSNSETYYGVTNDTLTLLNVASTFSGYLYRCVVSSSCATASTSSSASMTVNSTPSITNITEAPRCGNGSVVLSATASSGTINWYNSFTGGSVIATGNSFTTPVIASNTYYYVDATSGSCKTAERSSVLAAVISDMPSIIADPSNVTDCEGGYEIFSVIAGSNTTAYQWQVSTNGGSTWSNIIDNSLYSGAVTNTIHLLGVDRTMNNYRYRCSVSSTCSPAAVSNSALLTVNFPPEITVAPVRAWVCAGSVATFSVTASGNITGYQWQLSTNSGTSWSNITNNSTYSGATTSLLTITGTTTGMNNYLYRCVVTGSCLPSTTSGSAPLVTNTNTITINTQPANTSACAGIPTSLTVVASGPSLTYLWQYDLPGGGTTWNDISNGGIYSNATTATLNISDISTVVNYNYRCVISSTCATQVASGTATLSLNTATPTITSNPSNSVVCEGLGTSFSVAATVPSGTVLYQWQTSINGGSSWNNTLNSGVYSGANSTPLNLSSVAASMNNYRYRCQISSTSSSVCPLNSNQAILTVDPLPVTPTAAYSDLNNICVDDPGNISLSVSGGSGTTVRWFTGNCGGAVIGTGNPLVIASPEATTTYYARYETSCGNSTCASVTVTVLPLPVAPTSIITDNNNFCQSDDGDIHLTVTGGSGTLLHWFTGSCGGTEIGTGTPLTVPSPTTSTTYYAYYANSCGVSSCASLIVNVNPSPSVPTAPATQSFCGSAVISNLSVTPPSGCTVNWYPTASEGTPLASGYTLSNGGTYYAESLNSLTSCVSDTRTPVSVVITAATPAPTGSTSQSFCTTANPRVSDIVVNGVNLIWYTLSSGGSVIDPSTSLTNGTTYYASQTWGGCESPTRLGVTVTLNPCNPSVTLSVNTSSITEAGPGVATLTATLSYISLLNVTVNLGFTGTAIDGGTDYTAASNSIVVPAGSISATTTITAVNDNLYEPGAAETVIVDVTSVTNGTESGTQQQTVSITDSNTQPSVTLSVNNTSVTEAGGTSTITATLSNYSTQTVTVNLTYGGTATGSGTDYSSSGSVITIAAGSISGSVTVTAVDDNIYETTVNETVTADISSVTNGTESGIQQVSVEIVENDSQPSVTLTRNNATINEASGMCTFTATLSNPSVQNVTVNLGFTGTATGGGTDYTAAGTVITVTAGNLTGTTTVTAVDDNIYEPGANETIIADITSVVNGTENGTQQQTTAIVDNDSQPSVTLTRNNATIAEAAGVCTFTATLSNPSTQVVTVSLGFSGTATGGGTDYSSSGSNITIAAGSTSGTATVTAVDDNIYEPGANETVIVDITSVTNGIESGTQQQTTAIIDNDSQPTVTLTRNNATIAEAAGVCTFTATLSNPSTQTVTINLAYTGTATGGGIDYTASASSIVIAAGGLSGTATVTAVSDNIYEPGLNETVIVDISSVTNGTESGVQQQTTDIADDDTQPTVTLSQDYASISEAAGVCTITASLNHPSTQDITVNLGLSGTATGSGVDYNASGTSILIAAGSTSGTITVTAVDDNIYESAVNETVIVDITTVINGTENGTQQRTVTIVENDSQPSVTLSVDNTLITEGVLGVATFTASLNIASVQTVTVSLGFTGTATSGVDYNYSSNSITIPAGSLSGYITVTAISDNLDELNETVVVDITSVTNGSESGTQQKTTSIIDDDETPVINDQTVSVNENSPDGTSVVNLHDAITGTDNDGDGDPITYTIIAGNTAGTFAINPSTGEITVAMSANLNYEVTTSYVLTIRATDGLNVDQAQVTINVNNVNEAPVTVRDVVSMNEDGPALPVNVTANDSDPDGNSLAVSVLKAPVHGSAVVAGQMINYTPALNYFGKDTIIYRVCDNGIPSLCASDSVLITVIPVNDAPVAVNDVYTTFIGYTLNGNVLTNDYDVEGDVITINTVPVQDASHGDLTIYSNGSFVYVPDAGYEGADTVYYRICDNGTPSLCSNGRLIINITPVTNLKPVASDDVASVNEDQTLTGSSLLANDNDPDGNNLAINTVPVTNVAHGLLTINSDGTYSYTPSNNYYGSDSFRYEVCDDGVPSLCDTATVNITVQPVNDAPTAINDIASVNEDNTVVINVLANDSDAEGNPMTVTIMSGKAPVHGTAVVNPDGTISYTPSANFNGTDSLRYQVCDNASPVACSNAKVTITVVSVNDAPAAIAYSASCTGTSLSIAYANFVTDIENDPLTITITSAPVKGTVEITGDGHLLYHPSATGCGKDSLKYQACDTGPLCVTGTIYITIVPVDTDGDGIPDYIESLTADSDNDGTPNYMETDSDDDGIPDAVEVLGDMSDICNIVIANSDDDATPDYMDTDSDNDGIPDREDGIEDCDEDNIPNYRDADSCDRTIRVPEGFSPNGDGHNEFLVIKGLEFYPDHSITIFNRWGNVVYKAKPYNNDWDGTSSGSLTIGNQKLPAGTYFYVIKPGDGSKDITGYIYLAR